MPRAKSPSKKTASANGDAGTNGHGAAPGDQTPVSALQTSSAADSSVKRAKVSRPLTATDTSVYPSVSEEQIRRRAYELYMQRGGQGGSHVDDWYRAEAELRSHR